MFRKVVFVFAVLLSQLNFACGPFFPSSFLNGDEVAGKSDFITRLELLGDEFFPEVREMVFDRGIQSTVEADLVDFKDFLSQKNMTVAEQEKIINRYQQFAKACRRGQEISWHSKLDGIDEFVLYLTGARELKLNGDSYPKSWLKLLSLPAKDRKYRSIWVYYMTANFTKSDEDRISCYQKVRDLNLSGFHDRLGLAYASYMSAFKYTKDVLLKTTACVKAIYFYGGRDFYRQDKIKRLYVKFVDALSEQQLSLLAKDVLGREVLLSLANDHYRYYESDRAQVLSLLESVKDRPIKSASLAAWIAYSDGHYDLANRFSELAPSDDLIALWVRARLAQRNGETRKAAQLLKEWLTTYRRLASTPSVKRELGGYTFRFGDERKVDLPFAVRGALGLVYVSNRDFLLAMHTFLEVGANHDAWAVAEQCLSVEALRKYVDQYPQSTLQSILSHRYFRLGKYDLAYQYSRSKNKDDILRFVELMKKGENEVISKDDRALAYYNAAKILRHRGMELCGTYFSPDYAVVDGQYRNAIVGKDWQERFGLSLDKADWTYSDKRFHYRFDASDLMWKAVELAEVSALKGMAAYCGGRFIAHQDKLAADKFYKALVNSRCGQLSVAADAARWFPMNIETKQGEIIRFKAIEIIENELSKVEPSTLGSLEKVANDLMFDLSYFEYYQKKKMTKVNLK